LKLDDILADTARSELNLLKILELQHLSEQQLRSHNAHFKEVKDLLHLCVRQIDELPRGIPERIFYEAAYRKMDSLSGGDILPAPNWTISPLEVTMGGGWFLRVLKSR
jgi:hypothetical protein